MNENNEVNVINEVTNVAKESKAPVTAGKKASSVLISVLIVAGFLLLQVLVSAVGVIPKAIELQAEAGGDQARYAALYQEYVTTTPIIMQLQFAASLICLVVAAVWYYFGYARKAKADPDRKTFKKSFKGWPDAVLILTGTLTVSCLAGTLNDVIYRLSPKTAEGVSDMLNIALGGGTEILGILSAVVLAPVFEELLMRGIIFNRSKKVFGAIGCIAVTTVLFSLMHMNIVQGIYVIPLGIFFGYVAYRYNSVFLCMICHAINNLVGVMLPNIIHPVVFFIIFGCIAAFVGARFGIFIKEETLNVKEE